MKPTKNRTWVAIDKDGTEKISNSIFIRRYGITTLFWGAVKVNYSKNMFKKWANAWSNNEEDALPFTGTILPKGSIEKLIGKKMKWEDDPIEIFCNK